MCIATTSLILYFKWNGVRQTLNTYQGNAQIYGLISMESLDFCESMGGVIYGLISNIFGLAIQNIIAEVPISSAKFFVGLVELGAFSSLFTLVLLTPRRSSNYILFLFCYIVIHQGLQTWGSPNYGSLIRHRSIDYLALVITYFYYSHSRANASEPTTLSLKTPT